MKSKTPRLGYPPFPAVSELYLSYQWGLSRGNSGECREEMSGGGNEMARGMSYRSQAAYGHLGRLYAD